MSEAEEPTSEEDDVEEKQKKRRKRQRSVQAEDDAQKRTVSPKDGQNDRRKSAELLDKFACGAANLSSQESSSAPSPAVSPASPPKRREGKRKSPIKRQPQKTEDSGEWRAIAASGDCRKARVVRFRQWECHKTHSDLESLQCEK